VPGDVRQLADHRVLRRVIRMKTTNAFGGDDHQNRTDADLDLDLSFETLTGDPLEVEGLPTASLLGTWGSVATFGSASCPASTAATAGSASCA
jgi:hypothetical protein